MATPDGTIALALPEFREEVLQRVASGSYYNPHEVLGQHLVNAAGVSDPVTVIRTLRPLAREVSAVLANGARAQLTHLYGGIWQGVTITGLTDYVIEARYDDDAVWTADDPYRFSPTLGELDLHLIGEGRHEKLWQVLGARVEEKWGTDAPSAGTAFAVWAPHAKAVRVIGDFNSWNGVTHAMRSLGGTGVWELFIPELTTGGNYKFEILTQNDQWVRRADPMARYTEVPPLTASVIGTSSYEWSDGEWMRERAATNPHTHPMSVYEMHLGSWKLGLDYRSVADELIPYLQHTGFTHVEFMPLAEHPFGGSWGYQVTSYYAPTSRFGHPDDLRYLIDRLHQAGIGVLMDWVPGHFPTPARRCSPPTTSARATASRCERS